MRTFLLIASAALLAPNGAALAQPGPPAGPQPQCNLRIDTMASNWIIEGYDPFASDTASGTFDLVFVNQGEGPCEIYPILELDGEGYGLRTNSGGQRLAYALYDGFGGYDATPTAGRTVGRASRRSVVIEPGNQKLVRYQLEVAGEDVRGDGLYSQMVSVSAETAEGAPVAWRQIVVGLNVLPSARIGLAGAYQMRNGQALVDLGELREGPAPVPLQLRVSSTRNYRLTIESQNRGQLVLAGTEWAIPYGISIGGQDVPLSGGAGETAGPPAQGYSRAALPIQFRIGETTTQRAGTYGDVISISVAPN